VSVCEEVYDKDVMGSSQIRRTGEGGRIGKERKKTKPERRRLAQAKPGEERKPSEYKPRKDIGAQRPRSEREQQPERERGSAALSPKEAQRKAYLERKAKEKGEVKDTSASELLRKKKKKEEDKRPADQPKRPVVGMSRAERQKIIRAGERKLESLVRQSESEKQGIPPEKVKLKNFKKSWQ